MSRAPFAHDSDSQFVTAPTEHVRHAPDPFGAPSSDFENGHSAPVFATPSIVPALGFPSSDLGSEYDDADEPAVARKKPIWMMAVGALVLLGGVTVAGLQLADKHSAEEQRALQVEQVRQRMVALDVKRQSEEAARQLQVAQALPAGSSVAAMLAASTNSNGASALRPEAEKPNGRAAARQAAAIKRALSGPSAAGRRQVARSGGRGTKANRARAPKDEAEGLQESRSDDPIYGL